MRPLRESSLEIGDALGVANSPFSNLAVRLGLRHLLVRASAL